MYIHVYIYRCYAAVGDMSKARYLREVGEMADKITKETVEFMVDYK